MRTKPTKKTAKVHAVMQPEEMRLLREEMRFSLRDLSVVLGVPYRTLQDYEYGNRGIPLGFAMLLKREAESWSRFRREFYKNIDRRIAAEHPHGIPSAPEVD